MASPSKAQEYVLEQLSQGYQVLEPLSSPPLLVRPDGTRSTVAVRRDTITLMYQESWITRQQRSVQSEYGEADIWEITPRGKIVLEQIRERREQRRARPVS